MLFKYGSFMWLSEFLYDEETNNYCWYIYPYKGKISDDIIVISDEVKFDKHWFRSIGALISSTTNMALKRVLATFTETNIFYSDDLSGSDFKQAIDFEILR